MPPGYDTSGERYPVIYVLHGLPANDQAYKGITGYADSLASTGHPAIVVGAQGARPGDTDPEWHNWGTGRDWETATESELTAAGIPHVFNIYQGAHDGTFWREHQDEWLAAAVQRLDPPERSGS